MEESILNRTILRIRRRVLLYVEAKRLPTPDFTEGGPTLDDTIYTALVGEGMTESECFDWVVCSEEVDPTLDEEEALRRMDEIVRRARTRRGVPADRMNEAVSARFLENRYRG